MKNFMLTLMISLLLSGYATGVTSLEEIEPMLGDAVSIEKDEDGNITFTQLHP